MLAFGKLLEDATHCIFLLVVAVEQFLDDVLVSAGAGPHAHQLVNGVPQVLLVVLVIL